MRGEMASATDYTTALDGYLANADFAEVGSATKAKAAATYARKLMVLTPAMQGLGNDAPEIRYDMATLKALRDEAQSYADASPSTTTPGTGGSVLHADLRSFRE
jgi:hypothetical protein